MSHSDAAASLLLQLADEFAARCRRGERPSVQDYAERYPHLAQQIRDTFPAMVVMEQFGSVAAPATGSYADGVRFTAPVPERLGEYRILREVARGGMGVVYEAVQESLGRHVALKVLPPSLQAAPTHLERFRLEARAAAKLHHTNIVPVFGVGEHQGVHFYAMQFIRGQNLDAVIAELRRLRRKGTENAQAPTERPPGGPTPNAKAPESIAQALLAGQLTGPKPPSDAAATRAQGASTTGIILTSRADVPYYRSVAQLGVQVAEALAHAHQLGILHRDIKPGNLLLDDMGSVWITDFGLAKSDEAAGVTFQGDLVGTLRYMAPERFQGQADARSDVYSLGITLYELLTLQPAFAATDKAQLIERVLHEATPPPRTRDAGIPRDLDMIVVKAVSKAPEDRYATALELADDLRRYLEDRPILARKQNVWQRFKKWARRHQAVVRTALVAAVLCVAALGAMAGYMLHQRDEQERRAAEKIDREIQDRARENLERTRRAAAEVRRSLDEGRRVQALGRIPEAFAYALHAEDVLSRVDGQDDLRPEVAELLKDLRMQAKLEELGMTTPDLLAVQGLVFHQGLRKPAEHYRPLFREYGFDPMALPVEAAARHITRRKIADDLLEGLDKWSRMEQDEATRKRLRQIIRAAQPEGVLARWREAQAKGDKESMRVLLADLKPESVHASTLGFLGASALDAGLAEEGLKMLRRAHVAHPADFRIHLQLGALCQRVGPALRAEALRHSTAALALRPSSADAWFAVGTIMAREGKYKEACVALTKAVDLRPSYSSAYNNLAAAQLKLRAIADAEASFRLAIKHQPDVAHYWDNLAGLLVKEKNNRKEALECFERALKLDDKFSNAYSGRGMIRYIERKFDAALADFDKALRYDHDNSEAHAGIGWVLEERSRYPQAIKSFERALQINPDYPWAHYGVGVALHAWGKEIALRNRAEGHAKFDLAIARFRKVIELNEHNGDAWLALGNTQRDRGLMIEATNTFEKAAIIRTEDGKAAFNLGNMYARLGRFADAHAAYDRALKIEPGLVEARASLGAVLLDQGKFEEAAKILEVGVKIRPDQPQAVLNLAMCLDRQGRYREAIAVLEAGRAEFPKGTPELKDIENFILLYRRFSDLQGKIDDFASGSFTPTDAEERLLLAEVCMANRRPDVAVALFQQAFAQRPAAANNLADAHRYDAARAAACAGFSRDKNAKGDDIQQRAWRDQARTWLREDLALWLKQAERLGSTPDLIKTLARWRHHTHFAGVRDADGLARLPATEAVKWRLLWSDVEAILQRYPPP